MEQPQLRNGGVCKYWAASNGSDCPYTKCRHEHPPMSASLNPSAVSPLFDSPRNRANGLSVEPPSMPQPWRQQEAAEGEMLQPKLRRFVPKEPLKRSRPQHNAEEASVAGPSVPEMEDTKNLTGWKQSKRPRGEQVDGLHARSHSLRPPAMDAGRFNEVHQEAEKLLVDVASDRAQCQKLWLELQVAMKKREKALNCREEKVNTSLRWLITESKKAANMLSSSSSRPQEAERTRDPVLDKKARDVEQNLEQTRKYAEEARKYAEEAERSNAERAFQIAELRQRQDTLASQEMKLAEKQKRLDEAARKLVEREKQVALMEAKIRARQASFKQQQIERQKLRQAQNASDPSTAPEAPQQQQKPPSPPQQPGQFPPDSKPTRSNVETNAESQPPPQPEDPAVLCREPSGEAAGDYGIIVAVSPTSAEGEMGPEAGEEAPESGMELALVTPKPEPVGFGDRVVTDDLACEMDVKPGVVSPDEDGGEAGEGCLGVAVAAGEGATGGATGVVGAGSGERAVRGRRSGADKCRAMEPRMTVAEALFKDAPVLFQTLQEKGLLEGMELYPEPEDVEEDGEDDGDEGEGGEPGQFSDLRHVLKKIWESSNLINTGTKSHHSSESKQNYEVDVLIALLEQARHMDRKGAGPVTRYWCRQLQCFLFIFEWHNRVVLERPEYGYATYVFEVEEGERIDWQIQRLVTVMSVPGVGRLDIWTNKPLQDMRAISEHDVQLLESYGWQRGTGIGTFLNYSDRIVHDRGHDEDQNMWFKKVGKMLVDGRNRGRQTKQRLALPSASVPELTPPMQDGNALAEVKAEPCFHDD